jgi:hypothetical protein
MIRYLTTGQNHYLNATNTSFETCRIQVFGKTTTNQNWVRDEIKNKLNMENAATMQFKSFNFPSAAKKAKIKIHKLQFYLLFCMGVIPYILL